jgi:hypothetical protein
MSSTRVLATPGSPAVRHSTWSRAPSTVARVHRWTQAVSVTTEDDEDLQSARAIFAGRVDGKSACWHCGGIHATVAKLQPHQQPCPRIKRVERNADGFPLVTEYWPNGNWEDDVVFPHDVFDDDVNDD